MMTRSICVCSLWVCLLALSACQTAVPSEDARGIREASFVRESAAPAASPRVIDDVAAELLLAAASVQTAEQRVHCENIANVETIGYKRRVVIAETQQVAAQDASQFTVPKVVSVVSVFTTGRLEPTERSLDIAIDGDGFFSVLLADGQTGYTRNGRMTINQDGKLLVGVAGEIYSPDHVLIPEITVPSDTLEISIGPNGRVSGRTASSPDSVTQFGQLYLHRFLNPAGLLRSSWLSRVTERSGQPTTGNPGSNGLGVLKQGFLERSNVNLAAELMALQVLESKRSALLAVMRTYGIELP